MKRHLTRHGGAGGDALTLYVEQTRLLRDVFEAWADTAPSAVADGDEVDAARRHGTLSKLILEHAAVRVAASGDLVRVVDRHHRDGAAGGLARQRERTVDLLRRLDELARGRQPVDVGKQAAFDEVAGQLRATLADDLATDPGDLEERLAEALGDHRRELRPAHRLRTHAPTHPGRGSRWYRRIPGVVRLHTTYDRLRGFPWAESTPFADPSEADRFDPEP